MFLCKYLGYKYIYSQKQSTKINMNRYRVTITFVVIHTLLNLTMKFALDSNL